MNDTKRQYGYLNVYICDECGGETVTVDVDEGVTPYMLRCRAEGKEPTEDSCPGFAKSSMYRPMMPYPPPKWIFYRPTTEEIEKAEPGMKKHAENGGLFLRPVKEA